MQGPERDRLITEYHAAVKAYSEAVSRLVGLNGAEFDSAYKEAEALRELSEDRRATLETDQQKDSCPPLKS
jgi:hypothetical protein